MTLNLRLTIEVVENGYVVDESIRVEEESEWSKGTIYRHKTVVHIFHSAVEVAGYIEKRLEEY